MEIGDKLCIMFGCAFPVVLRAENGGYVVVDDATVDGLGVVESERDPEGGMYKVEEFNIG